MFGQISNTIQESLVNNTIALIDVLLIYFFNVL